MLADDPTHARPIVACMLKGRVNITPIEASRGTRRSAISNVRGDNYQLRGKLAWHEIKDAVRDAWNRATGNR